MAKLTTKDPIRYELPGQDDVPEGQRAAVYIQPPTGRTWRRLQEALLRECSPPRSEGQMMALLREGIAAVQPDEDDPGRQDAEALIDAAEARLDGQGDPLSEDDTWRLAEYERIVRDAYQPYADAQAARVHWDGAFVDLATQHFVTAFEGVTDGDGQEVEARIERGLLADDIVGALPRAWKQAISGKAADLHRPNSRQLGNSRSRSPGRGTERNSVTATADASAASADDAGAET